MAQEDKELLLKDLCARLPYGVVIQYHTDYDWAPVKMHNTSAYGLFNDSYRLGNCKPYLRPMSSMTEEEREEYCSFSLGGDWASNRYMTVPAFKVLDWLNAHHFDYRGLIEEGLALEAPKDMYKTE